MQTRRRNHCVYDEEFCVSVSSIRQVGPTSYATQRGSCCMLLRSDNVSTRSGRLFSKTTSSERHLPQGDRGRAESGQRPQRLQPHAQPPVGPDLRCLSDVSRADTCCLDFRVCMLAHYTPPHAPLRPRLPKRRACTCGRGASICKPGAHRDTRLGPCHKLPAEAHETDQERHMLRLLHFHRAFPPHACRHASTRRPPKHRKPYQDLRPQGICLGRSTCCSSFGRASWRRWRPAAVHCC